MKHYYLLIAALFIFASYNAAAQTGTYILNGSAHQDKCNCYTLTPDSAYLSGSVWNREKISLQNSFDFAFNVFLGCKDNKGADGISFILQNVDTTIGGNGGGMGFQGVYPAIGVTLDTWQNNDTGNSIEAQNDPPYDHISIQANGNVKHGNDLAGPVPASATSDNIEDCHWHSFRITWDASTHWLEAYFDGVLRVQANVNLVDDIFNNDPMVYWGFGGSSGGYYNLQKFCTYLNPDFKTTLPQDTVCNNAAFTVQDLSESFSPIKSYFWSFGDGTVSTSPYPPAHSYTEPGMYPIKLAITGQDGCNSDTLTKIITVASTPVADFTIKDACYGTSPEIIDQSHNTVGVIQQWNWQLNNGTRYTGSQPKIENVPEGTHAIQVNVTSEYGCTSETVTKSFTINPIPQIRSEGANGCVNQAIPFTLTQTDQSLSIKQWYWDFGDNLFSTGRNTHHIYNKPGTYNVQSWALANNGCQSNRNMHTVTIYPSYANAGRDTVVLKNTPVQLQAQGTGVFEWFPNEGLNNDAIPNPIAVINSDQTYVLTVTTPEGCVAKDTITIKVFKGSAIYVPNAFTPNGNGLNDRLKPLYSGIRKLDFFTIYNRWGQIVFTTSNMGQGWDGTDKGQALSTGTYVWMLKAEDIDGYVYQTKGTVTIIR